MLLLKKETRRISLWLIISLQSENQRNESLILTYMMTLGKSFTKLNSLVKVSQFGWFGMPTKGMPS